MAKTCPAFLSVRNVRVQIISKKMSAMANTDFFVLISSVDTLYSCKNKVFPVNFYVTAGFLETRILITPRSRIMATSKASKGQSRCHCRELKIKNSYKPVPKAALKQNNQEVQSKTVVVISDSEDDEHQALLSPANKE